MMRRQNYFNLFSRRKSNRNMLWTSLIGLGVSAAAIGVNKFRNTDMKHPLQNVMDRVQPRNRGDMSTMAAATELSKEIAPFMEALDKK
jgi:hypothetical protein